jgi:hypothetical protein
MIFKIEFDRYRHMIPYTTAKFQNNNNEVDLSVRVLESSLLIKRRRQ